MSEDLSRLAAEYLRVLRSKPSKIVSTEEALKDVKPVDWSDDVLDGTRKVMVEFDEEQNVEGEDGVPWIAK